MTDDDFMSIHAATLNDLPRLVELGRRLHGLSTYSSLPFVDEKVEELLRSLIGGAGVVFVAVSGTEQINGGFAGAVAPYWFNHELHGFDFSFFIEPETRHGTTALRLLLAFEHWCRGKGVSQIRLGSTTGLDVAGVTRFYEWAGYRQTGVLFLKELTDGN